LNAIDQAWYPARGLWLLIRMAGMRALFCMIERQLAIAREFCMTLMPVEQSGAGRVKRIGRDQAEGFGDFRSFEIELR
jgi:hypothetical protein